MSIENGSWTTKVPSKVKKRAKKARNKKQRQVPVSKKPGKCIKGFVD